MAVMRAALRAKFTSHAGPRSMLLSTAATGAPAGGGAGSSVNESSGRSGSGPAADGGLLLVEASPHDFFWGRGFDGSGSNMLGCLLMELRAQLRAEEVADEWRAGDEGRPLGAVTAPTGTR